MAIDLGNFGNTQAQLSSIAPARPGNVGAQVSTIARTFQAKIDEQQRAQAQEQAEIDRGRMAIDIARFGNDLDEISTSVFADVQAGTLKPEEATNAFTQRAQELRERILLDVDDRLKRPLGDALELTRTRATPGVMRAQQGYIQKGYGDQINAAGEELGRMALRDPNEAANKFSLIVDTIGPKAGLDTASLGKAKTAFAETAFFDNRAAFINNTDSIDALRQEREKLADPDYLPALAPNKRNALQDAADSKLRSLEANQRAIVREQNDIAESQARTVMSLMEDGTTLSPGVWESAYALAERGDAIGEAVKLSIDRYKTAQRVNELPIQEQGQLVQDIGNQVETAATPEAAASKRAEYERAARIYNGNLQRISKEPWKQYEAVTGEIVPPIRMDGDLIGQLKQRESVQRRAAERLGVSPGLLKNEEIEQFTMALDQMPTNKQVELFQGIAQMTTDQGRSTFAALKKANPIYSHIALSAAQGYRESNGMLTADILARGAKLLKDKASAAPLGLAGAELRAAEDKFSEQTRGMFANAAEQRGQLLEMTRAAYARFSEMAGDYSGSFNSDRWEKALSVSSGGIGELNGYKVIKPYGMKDDDFESKASALLSVLSADFPPERRRAIMRRSRLEPSGAPNSYHILLDGQMLTKNNKPIQVRIK